MLRDSAAEGLPSLAGVHDVSDASDFLQLLAGGALLTVRDYADYEPLPSHTRQKFVALGFRSMMAAPLVKDGQLIATLLVGDTQIRDWSASEASLLADVAERTWAAVERARAEAALRRSEKRFRQFVDASSDILWIRDANTFEMEFASPAIAPILGVTPQEVMADPRLMTAIVLPEDREDVARHITEVLAGRPVVHDCRIRRPTDQAFRWIRSTMFPVFNDAGEVVRLAGISQDVTETTLAKEHQGILVAELQHRVRNIMAIIRSMTRRSADGATDVTDYRARLEGRLMALARVQALLTREENAGGSLRDVIATEVAAQAHGGEQFDLAGPQIRLSPKAVEVLTLAFHKLATSAIKYGAFAAPEGRLQVMWSTFERRGQPWVALDWIETGAPPRAASTRRGFGSDLIEGRIPYELGGAGKLTLNSSGAHCRLEFPLKDGDSILETDAPTLTTDPEVIPPELAAVPRLQKPVALQRVVEVVSEL